MSVAAAIDLGTYEVAASAADAAAFRSATGVAGDSGDTLSFTYPIRWMALPAPRAAIIAMAPEPGLVPFHESQTFEYAASLRAGERYTMRLRGRRESTPDRLVVDGMIAAADGTQVATIETVLRLFAMHEAVHG